MKQKWSHLSTEAKLKWIIVYIFMILLVLLSALPLIYMVSTAFKPLPRIVFISADFFYKKSNIAEF